MAKTLSEPRPVKFHAGKYLIPGTIAERGKSYVLTFGYNKDLIAEIKSMESAKWLGTDGGPKAWSIAKNARNAFQLDWLLGGNPYLPYDKPLDEYDFLRSL